jgi:serine/threonine protein kinase/tetratricopeptide (TPR) repeat protein
MAGISPELKAIFWEALDCPSEAERRAYLDRACQGDVALRSRIEALLVAHQDVGGFLESPVGPPTAGAATTADLVPLSEGPGTVIGPYKLLEQIGEGGMGVVYMAEQARPVHRKVALKIIKPGMDSCQIIARFEAERQALALMDHPHIAQVHDAGATDSGRPYFVMELVKGIPITDYCDHNRLAIADRLELFVLVCQAVQHAHQKGIIHRDLKPSNILVTLIDGAAVPKIIDFGVAKAVGQKLTEKTLFTGFAQLIGTPLYMSPEQAAFSGVDVDTRSDIHSLGVLLYELLTGTTPFDAETFRTAGYDEMRRIIREQEPPKPSTRILLPSRRGGKEGLPLSTLETTATTISANRQTDPRRLRKALRGELDWIVMKALEKDRNRRYGTANTLVADLRRHLNHEPVEAGPPSTWYRLRKGVRRNRAVLGVAAGFAAVLITATAFSTRQAWRASRAEAVARRRLEEVQRAGAAREAALKQSEEARAQSEAVSSFLVEAFRSPDPAQSGREVKVADVLDRASKRLDQQFAGSPATQAALLDALGTTYRGLGLYDKAVSLHTKAAAVREAALGPDHPDTLQSRGHLAAAYSAAGRLSEAIALYEATLRLQEARLGPDHPDTLISRNNLANAYRKAGRLSEATALYEATLKHREAVLGPDHPDTLQCRASLAIAYAAAGRLSDAIALFETTLKLREVKLGLDHPDTLQSRHNLANAYFLAGRLSEAIALHEATFKLKEAKLGPDHPLTLASRSSLANAYYLAGRLSEAIALHEATLKLRQAVLGPDHPDTLASRNNLANAYQAAGRLSEAIALDEATLKLSEAKLGPDHPTTLDSRGNLALDYESLGRGAEAEHLQRDVLASRRKTVKPDSPLLAGDLAALGRNLLMQSRCSEAEPLLREALAIRAKATPDDWTRYDAMSLLGGALLGRRRSAEAEPLMVAGYEGMKLREARIPVPDQVRLREAAERMVRLYEERGKKNESARWRKEMETHKRSQ